MNIFEVFNAIKFFNEIAYLIEKEKNAESSTLEQKNSFANYYANEF